MPGAAVRPASDLIGACGLRRIIGPPAHEFLEADQGIAIVVGGFERQQAFIDGKIVIQCLQQCLEFIAADLAIAVNVAQVKRLAQLLELIRGHVLHAFLL